MTIKTSQEECWSCHSLFKGHKVIVSIVVLNCQQCNQCLKCQVSGHSNNTHSESELPQKRMHTCHLLVGLIIEIIVKANLV